MQEVCRDIWSRVVSGALFPLHERLKGHSTGDVLRRLERSQWRDPDYLEEERADRLCRFLHRAGRDVPYYRALFADMNIDPRDVRGATDLAGLPLLDKATIRSRFEDLRARNAATLQTMSTGGSSGEPLTFLLGKERISHDVAAKWRATRWWGVDIGDPEAVVWGSPIEVGAQDRVRALRDFLFRTRLFPAFSMSDEAMDGYLEEIARTRPRMLFGYPSALDLLARRAEATDRGLDRIGIRVAFCTGERLYSDQRDRIGRVFGCPVANGYGAREAGFIAHECPRGGMHVMAEDIVLEIVDRRGAPLPSGQPGEIVVTNLATGEFPFIRYRTGDIGVLDTESCACGRTLPLLREVQGRSTDFVVAADGTRVHGLALIYVLREEPAIAAFRIYQPDRLHVIVQVVANEAGETELGQRIRKGINERLGDTIDVQIEFVARIPPDPSGKFRYVVSTAS